MNIFSYIDKYKYITFDEEPFNVIDNLIFSSLAYIDFDKNNFNEKSKIRLEDLGISFNEWYENNNIKYNDPFKLDNVKILKEIYNTPRYRDSLIYNYVNIINKDMQFCAMTIKINKNILVAFRGTDETLVGWKEDFKMIYTFPVDAHVYAINYLNKTIKFFDQNVIVLGHSKGGNLALVASMYCSPIVRLKIISIFNNDGPGLRKAQIESKEYEKIKSKYFHIVPDYSYIGALAINNEYNDIIIKSLKKGPYVHHMVNWEVNDNSLVLAKQSKFSENLKNSSLMWLNDHDDQKRKKVIEEIFKILEESNVKTTYDFKNIKVATNVIKNMKKLDDETKKLALDFLKFNINYQIENRK